jgi:hypothetical protein
MDLGRGGLAVEWRQRVTLSASVREEKTGTFPVLTPECPWLPIYHRMGQVFQILAHFLSLPQFAKKSPCQTRWTEPSQARPKLATVHEMELGSVHLISGSSKTRAERKKTRAS